MPLGFYSSPIEARNCIFSGQPSIRDLFTTASSAVISNSYFDTLDCSTLPPNVTCGPGILTGIDPLFVNPDSGDFRLQPCSPLIDAGNSAYVSPGDSTDLAGLPRIRGAAVDIGAYEAQGPSLAAAPIATPSCPGGASGALQLDVQDACAPLHIAWQSGALSGTLLNELPAGAYSLTITDARGQSAVFAASVPAGPGPALLSASAPVACGDTLGGSASAALDAGTPPYAYAWAGGATDSLRTGLPAGPYALTITDSRGCSAAGTVEVDKTGNLSVSVDVRDISCFAAADGAFTVLPENGKAPFLWLWDDGSATPLREDLGPGSYAGTLTDALGCSIQWILPLNEPEALQLTAQVTDATDSIAADGRIDLLPAGGTAPYEVLWSNGGTGLSLDSLSPGTYLVTLTDRHGCAAEAAYKVGVTVGTDEMAAEAAFVLYPNPARDWVWLVFGRAAGQERLLRVWDAAGREALRARVGGGAERVRLPVGVLPRGLYTVQVQGAVRSLVLR